jgi:Tol biopolymer transport system component
VRQDGTGLRNLTRNPAGVSALDPTWSPDGRRIAFRRTAPRPTGTGVYSIGLDGRGLRRLVANGSAPDWSPDGRLVAYLAPAAAPSSGEQVHVVRPNGSKPRLLTRGGSWAFPRWSPDARRLVAAFDERRLAVLRLDGTVARWLTERRPGFVIDGVDW